MTTMQTIDSNEIQRLLTTKQLGGQIVFAPQTESTNKDAALLAERGMPHGTLALADFQSAGRGRRGRNWLGAEGENVFMSIVLRNNVALDIAPRYTFAAALAVATALRSFGIIGQIKWPNDVLTNGKKLCGILMEANADFIICGIGINVNQIAMPQEVEGIATSIYIETGENISRNEIIALVLNKLEFLLEECASDAGFARLLRQYKALSCTYLQEVEIIGVNGSVYGKVMDFDTLGRIILDAGEKGVITVHSGDVSLRMRQ